MKLLVEVTEVQQLQKLFALWHKSYMSLLRLEFLNGNHYRKGESFYLGGSFNLGRSHSEYFYAS